MRWKWPSDPAAVLLSRTWESMEWRWLGGPEFGSGVDWRIGREWGMGSPGIAQETSVIGHAVSPSFSFGDSWSRVLWVVTVFLVVVVVQREGHHRNTRFSAVRYPRFLVIGYSTRWRIQGSFRSSSSRLLPVQTQPKTQYRASIFTDRLVQYIGQPKLCTRKTELALQMKSHRDFSEITWPWCRTLANGIDVKYIFPPGCEVYFSLRTRLCTTSSTWLSAWSPPSCRSPSWVSCLSLSWACSQFVWPHNRYHWLEVDHTRSARPWLF